ncbi:Thymocyte nuclear 1 [Fusarium napiforme]|uniref:Thymocyte nuclear 1 n=1 Tax=Fusarium napiforme TaxID=42672 RepID=A0A8H5I480_9HYPO|nr:Thymocyte nuclear 1 [Fusarium napiforme]
MPPRKRSAPTVDASEEAAPKRRSLRQAAKGNPEPEAPAPAKASPPKKVAKATNVKKQEKPKAPAKPAKPAKTEKPEAPKEKKTAKKQEPAQSSSRGVSEDPDIDSIPTINPDAPKHDGQWYWLMKAEPETRIENGVDVKFSIDDLKAKTEPEGWDARNNMRNMNAGDLAFFYARSARQPGAPYYDPKSTKEKPIWDLVHVEFRKKFAVPIGLKELRELGKPGGPLEMMQLLKQSRLSVSKVSSEEWRFLCELADEKANDAGVDKPGKTEWYRVGSPDAYGKVIKLFGRIDEGKFHGAKGQKLSIKGVKGKVWGKVIDLMDKSPKDAIQIFDDVFCNLGPAILTITADRWDGTASVLIFYLRFTVDMRFIICAYAMLFVVMANCIFHTIAAIEYECPAYKGGNCQAIVDIYATSAVINSVSDLILLLLPIWLLHPMKVPLTRKIGISLILMAGGL